MRGRYLPIQSLAELWARAGSINIKLAGAYSSTLGRAIELLRCKRLASWDPPFEKTGADRVRAMALRVGPTAGRLPVGRDPLGPEVARRPGGLRRFP